MNREKLGSDSKLVLKEAKTATLVVSENIVSLRCRSEVGPVNIEFSVDLLPRVIALCLHIAGRIPQSEDDELVALKPEGWVVQELSGKTIGIGFNLPGGSPLTFCMEAKDARDLAQVIFERVGGLEDGGLH